MSAAFVIISILTLAAALAAATLRKLMHAALSFAVAFVGLAAFFFCSARSSSAWCKSLFTSARSQS